MSTRRQLTNLLIIEWEGESVKKIITFTSHQGVKMLGGFILLM